MIYKDGFIVTLDSEEELLLSNFAIRSFSNVYPHTVRDEETLLSIANDFYKDSSYWYIISEFNNLEDPFVLTTGTILNIPISA